MSEQSQSPDNRCSDCPGRFGCGGVMCEACPHRAVKERHHQEPVTEKLVIRCRHVSLTIEGKGRTRQLFFGPGLACLHVGSKYSCQSFALSLFQRNMVWTKVSESRYVAVITVDYYEEGE